MDVMSFFSLSHPLVFECYLGDKCFIEILFFRVLDTYRNVHMRTYYFTCRCASQSIISVSRKYNSMDHFP